MILLVQRGVPEGDDGVTFVLVDSAALFLDHLCHCGEITVKQGGQALGLQPLGNGGEALEVGKKDRDFPAFPPETEAVGILNQPVDDVRTQILAEGAFDESALFAFGGVVDDTGSRE